MNKSAHQHILTLSKLGLLPKLQWATSGINYSQWEKQFLRYLCKDSELCVHVLVHVCVVT